MKKTIYPREFYLKQLRPFYGSDLIKVVTGIRRCGKSSLLLSVMEELRRTGVPDENVAYVNLDERSLRKVRTADQLEQVILEKTKEAHGGTKYLFVDEVQNVDGFELVLNGFREEGDFSIFITGSNSYLLSGELATKLTGRYLEFDMFTLSFREYEDMKSYMGISRQEKERVAFDNYLLNGGFPQSLDFTNPEAHHRYVTELLQQIIQKDVRTRFKIRHITVFQKVLRYIVSNFGAPTNLKQIAAYLRNTDDLVVRPETLGRYLDYLVKARILYPCLNFDLKSRQSLREHGKYYLADTGLYFAINNDARMNYGPLLENLLFVYLTARGYLLSVGRIGKLECDFIAHKSNQYFYIQVAMTIADRATEDREYRVLETIRDNYPKYLFTLDPLLQRRNGIVHKNLIDFILSEEDL